MEELAYALTNAPEDVAAVLRWLAANGFERTDPESDTAGAWMGYIRIEYTRDRTQVVVARERQCWEVLLSGPDGHSQHLLEYVVAAMTGVDVPTYVGAPWPAPAQNAFALPWRETVPAALAWLASGDRIAEVRAAQDRYADANRRAWADDA
ncbi:MAG TPA: hypothetical protein VNQ77_01085 [Frankiaceae bacterium]|nr:hypothetical protein [Frankiaceae bacterium]